MLLFHNLWVASEVYKLSRVPATLHWALKLSNAPTQIRRRTPRTCATTATIREASQRWQVPVLIPTSLIILMGFVKTATWPNITSRERRSNKIRRLKSKLPRLERVEHYKRRPLRMCWYLVRQILNSSSQFLLTRKKTRTSLTSFHFRQACQTQPQMNKRSKKRIKKGKD